MTDRAGECGEYFRCIQAQANRLGPVIPRPRDAGPGDGLHVQALRSIKGTMACSVTQWYFLQLH